MLGSVSKCFFHLNLAFKGTLQLGTAKKITAQADVAVDVVNTANNYFYAEVKEFTMRRIVEAFELKVILPKALEQTGFPDGVFVSFSPVSRGKSISI